MQTFCDKEGIIIDELDNANSLDMTSGAAIDGMQAQDINRLKVYRVAKSEVGLAVAIEGRERQPLIVKQETPQEPAEPTAMDTEGSPSPAASGGPAVAGL